jgi:hypothetical protein
MAWRPSPRGRSRVANPGLRSSFIVMAKSGDRPGHPSSKAGNLDARLKAGHDARVVNNKTWHKARWLYSATLEAWQAIARMFASTNFTETSV